MSEDKQKLIDELETLMKELGISTFNKLWEEANVSRDRWYRITNPSVTTKAARNDIDDLIKGLNESVEGNKQRVNGEQKNRLYSAIGMVMNQSIIDTTSKLPISPEPLPTLRAIILTALEVEYNAVRAHLSNIREENHEKGNIYEVGTFTDPNSNHSWEILIAQVGVGNPGAASATERAIAHFNPHVALFVGIAGGVKDVKIGDVVVAVKVYSYEVGKLIDDDIFQPRPDVGNVSFRLQERAKVEARKRDWLKRIKIDNSFGSNEVAPEAKAFLGAIAAGEKVLASTRSTVYKFLKNNYGDTLAVEMEGRGFLQAVAANEEVRSIVVRGISDLLDEKAKADTSGSQLIASARASAFAFEILAKVALT